MTYNSTGDKVVDSTGDEDEAFFAFYRDAELMLNCALDEAKRIWKAALAYERSKEEA